MYIVTFLITEPKDIYSPLIRMRHLILNGWFSLQNNWIFCWILVHAKNPIYSYYNMFPMHRHTGLMVWCWHWLMRLLYFGWRWHLIYFSNRSRLGFTDECFFRHVICEMTANQTERKHFFGFYTLNLLLESCIIYPVRFPNENNTACCVACQSQMSKTLPILRHSRFDLEEDALKEGLTGEM